MRNGQRNLFVTLASNDYVNQAKQLFASAYLFGGWDEDYMLLAHNISEENLKWFEKKNIIIKKCKQIVNHNWGDNKEFSPMIADKLYLFTDQFRKWRTIVYMDSDILIKVPLNRLKRVKSFAAVREFPFRSNVNRLSSQLYNNIDLRKSYQKINFNNYAFNAGVMVFNSAIITNELYDYFKLDIIKNMNKYRYGEQTALNIHFYKMWKRLPLIYNCCVLYLINVDIKRLNKCVLHFAGSNEKPFFLSSENSFYDDWETNFTNAEEIDFRKKPEVKGLNMLTELLIALRYWLLLIFSYFKDLLQKKKCKTKDIINRGVGKIGEQIKKYNPNLYNLLKRKRLEKK